MEGITFRVSRRTFHGVDLCVPSQEKDFANQKVRRSCKIRSQVLGEKGHARKASRR